MDLAAFADLEPAQLAQLLPAYLAAFIDDPHAARGADRDIAALTATWTEAQAAEIVEHLRTLGQEPKVYRAAPRAQAVSRAWSRHVMPQTLVANLEHLRKAAAQGPVILLGNHLAYLDSTAIDFALHRASATDLADRIISLAGPKVYAEPFRRFASACLSTLPVPQSGQIEHAASVSPRELARRALSAIRAGHEALVDGQILLIYGEGSRSRTGRLGPFLPGVARYLKVQGARVVPFALTGTQHIMPLGKTRVSVGSVRIDLGEPIPIEELGGPRAALDAAHARVAELLPQEFRPS